MRTRIELSVPALVIGTLLATPWLGGCSSTASPAARSASKTYAPAPMQPTPLDKLQLIGQDVGMATMKGPDHIIAAGEPPRLRVELINYPGSVEHYTPDSPGRPSVNPCNYRTLVKNFLAADLPGVDPARKDTYTEPKKYWAGPGEPQAVPVVRLSPGGQTLEVKFGPLPSSMYVVRVIAALRSADVTPVPKDLIVECKINDGPNGEISDYILRQRGIDAFYSMGEFYFHVEDNRAFTAEIGLHPDSNVDLFVHNIDVHDLMAECAKAPRKTQSIMLPADKLTGLWKCDPETKLSPARQGQWAKVLTPEQIAERVKDLRAEFPGKSDDELLAVWRQRRDADIWNGLPPLNINLVGDEWDATQLNYPLNYPLGDPGTQAQLKAQGDLPLKYTYEDAIFGPFRLVAKDANGKIQGVYTLADLKAHKPYPGLPFAAPEWGKRLTDKDGKAWFFAPMTEACNRALHLASRESGFYGGGQPGHFEQKLLGAEFVQKADIAMGRDLAMLLIRYAYDNPGRHPNQYFTRIVLPQDRFNAYRNWRRFYQFYEPIGQCEAYDYLFPLIKDNQELADAVGRFIPWVKTPADVRQLLDTYLIQFTARQLAYWQYWYDHGNAGFMARVAAYQIDPEIARPWVDIIFNRTWEYPLPMAGVQDYLMLSLQRDGTTNIGSSYYTGIGGVEVAKGLESYIKHGGDAKYNLSDPRLYPRVVAGPYFRLEGVLAGMHALAIGDVGGFCQPYAVEMERKLGDGASAGWRWTHDSRFAYMAVNYGVRESETDAEWQAMVDAAKGVRNPFMSNRSRILSDWGGILEGGTQSDDFRFRHAARVRVGWGTGHSQNDSLDLGLWSLGLGMSGDAGARWGDGFPQVHLSKVHNLVTVDGKDWTGFTWVPQLADLDGCQYLQAAGLYQKDYRRQVALIELDKGRPAKNPPSQANLGPGTTYDNDVVLPRAYFVDFFRTTGGKVHSYNFHAFDEDEFTTNVARGALTDGEKASMKDYILDGQQWGGAIDSDSLTATFRMSRTPGTFVHPQRREYKTPACEPAQMDKAYDPNSPRKFLRVHVLGQTGARMLTGEAVLAPEGTDRTDGEMYRQVHVVRPAAAGEADSLFAAVYEPYAGQPTIRTVRFTGNPNDAESYGAVYVNTVDNIEDVIFADSSHANERTVQIGGDQVKLQADFGYFSFDEHGLRQISLVGAKLLSGPALTIRPEVNEWSAKVVDVDHLNRIVTLDRALPAKALDGAFFEVGSPAKDGHDEHRTTFEAVRVQPQGEGRSVLQWRKGSDVFSGKISAADVDANDPSKVTVHTDIAPTLIPGENAQLVATNDEHRQYWRCDYAVKKTYRGDNALDGVFTFYGAAIPAGFFKPGERLYVYEFGVGDTWRTPAKVSLNRVHDDVYRVQTNTPFAISVADAKASWSTDGTNWTPFTVEGARQTWKFGADLLGAENVFIRLNADKP